MQTASNAIIDKEDVFTFGIFNYEIPPQKLGEDAFEYLNSKIPAYRIIYEDFIEFDSIGNRIINHATGEMARDVSEIIGIGVGLKASTSLFNYQRKNIVRIGISERKEKRLDFILKENSRVVEIETKGTVIPSNVSKMIQHTKDKKLGKPAGISRYGFIVEQRKADETNPSIIHVTDPLGDPIEIDEDIFYFGFYYLPYFMYILDNPDYNKVVKKIIKKTKFRKYLVQKEKIKYRYRFEDKVYLGQCFDNRLVIETIKKYASNSRNVDQLFNMLTSSCGKTKYFLGIDENILDFLNSRMANNLINYSITETYINNSNYSQLRLSDGTLLIISKNGALPTMEDVFPEEDVKNRLREFYDYSNNERHPCGAPCRSREKEGKPCDIMTYRSNCHFHR
jgi:hypothetical protein